MSLITLIAVCVVVGVLLLLINRFVPMDPKIKTVMNWAVVIFLVLWLLAAFGVLDGVNDIRIGT